MSQQNYLKEWDLIVEKLRATVSRIPPATEKEMYLRRHARVQAKVSGSIYAATLVALLVMTTVTSIDALIVVTTLSISLIGLIMSGVLWWANRER